MTGKVGAMTMLISKGFGGHLSTRGRTCTSGILSQNERPIPQNGLNGTILRDCINL